MTEQQDGAGATDAVADSTPDASQMPASQMPVSQMPAAQEPTSQDRASRERTSRAGGFRRVQIAGVGFDAATEPEVVDRVFSDLDRRSGGLILTVNTDIMRQIGHHHDITRDATLTVADGMPLVWVSKVIGDPLPARVTGASLVPTLSRRAAVEGRSVFLFGAAPGVAERAAEALVAESPGLKVAGAYSPPKGFDADPAQFRAAIDRLVEAQPDIVYVALGFPRQEQFALRALDRLPATWFVGCGGALDMAAGDVARANNLVQRLGAEWLHRLAKEPRRLGKRYLVQGVPFTVGLLGRAVRRRVRETVGTDAPTPATANPDAPTAPVATSGDAEAPAD